VTSSTDKASVIPVLTGNAVDIQSKAQRERSIGTILIQAGRLSFEDAERILQLQHEQGILFGDAATQLGLLNQDDINFALSRQFGYQYLTHGESKVSESMVCAYAPFSPQAQTISSLRGQLLLRWFDENPAHRALAVISAERNEGRSFIASNLAVSFSQLGQKTLLIDADMRNPCQHTLFGFDNRGGLSTLLSGRGTPDQLIQPIAGLAGLSVLPAGPIPPNPLELLARPLFPELLAGLTQTFDVILLDSPSAAECSDAQSIAVRAGAAIIVARKNFTHMWRVRGVSDTLEHASATILGTVLNDF